MALEPDVVCLDLIFGGAGVAAEEVSDSLEEHMAITDYFINLTK